MTKELTEKQQRFLDVLFNEAEGDYVAAKKLAGYSEDTPTSRVVAALETEIAALVAKYIRQGSVKAAWTLQDVFNNPMQMGMKDKVKVAQDWLDRAGFGKTEKVEVNTTGGLFILPSKEK